MKQILITLDLPHIEALEKQRDKEAIVKVYNSKFDILILLSFKGGSKIISISGFSWKCEKADNGWKIPS